MKCFSKLTVERTVERTAGLYNAKKTTNVIQQVFILILLVQLAKHLMQDFSIYTACE